MANILRLKRWKTYLTDGRSSVEYDASKSKVAVAVIVGFEPAKIGVDDDFINVDDVILDMAKHILKCRAKRKTRKKPRK